MAFVNALPGIGMQLLQQREGQQDRGGAEDWSPEQPDTVHVELLDGQLLVRFPHPLSVMTSNSLLVRASYWALWDIMRQQISTSLASKRQRGFVITGVLDRILTGAWSST